ncbi:MAG: phosphoglucosamine mutase [Alphaproteobacteria bacterium]|nr:phosphoglucosamine mutase [Alphaproteobacteria bacterium]
MSEKLFGTDGVRGVANIYPLTIDFCMHLALILSRNICTRQHRVAIARDTRISGQMLFSALAAGFTSQGVDVVELGVVPTPFCTTLTPHLNVDMSIMITASHNPYRDNGLKLIDANGDKFSDTATAELEKAIADETDKTVYNTDKIGVISTCGNVLQHYLDIAAQIAPNAEALKNMRIALDSANGSFSGILTKVFKALGADVVSLAETPNGVNINADCGSQHTEKLAQTVREQNCCMGIAVDGDGDRIIICDEQGNRLDGDQIIAYLGTYLHRHHLLKGNTVVATVYSNLGLGKYIKSLGINYQTSAVGERYVIDKMRETGSNLGGEESGHMVLSDYSKTGDALIAAVVVALGIKQDGRRVSEIFPVFKPFPSVSHNLRFDSKEIINTVMSASEVQNLIDEIRQRLSGHGTILVRKSGTEPVIRLKIEDEDAAVAQNEAAQLLDCIHRIAGV